MATMRKGSEEYTTAIPDEDWHDEKMRNLATPAERETSITARIVRMAAVTMMLGELHELADMAARGAQSERERTLAREFMEAVETVS